MKTKLIELIDFEKVDTLLEGFSKLTGFVTAIIDLEGTVLSKSGWRHICTEFHRVHPETSKKCTNSDTELAGKLAEGEKYHFYTCLNGLVDVAVPIVINGEHIANLFSGQFFFEKPDPSFFKKQAEKYGFDEKKYLKALDEVPVVSKENVQVAMDFLLNMTQLISETIFQKLEQMELTEKISQSQDYNRMLFERSQMGLALVAMDGKMIDVNPAFASIIGRTVEETKQLSYWEVTPEKYAEQEQEQLKSLKKTGHYGPYEKEYIHKDGHLVPVRLQGLIVEQKGEKYIWSSVEDISEQKQAEAALHDSEHKFRSIIESSPVGNYIYQLQEDGQLIFMGANSAADRIIGIDHRALIGKTIQQAFPKLSQSELPEMYAKIAKGEIKTQSFELAYSENKITGFFQVTVFNIGTNLIAVDFMDISERKESERKMALASQQIRYHIENSPLAVIEWDEEFKIKQWTAQAEKFFGWSEEEVVNKYPTDWKFVHEDDVQKVNNVMGALLKGEVTKNISSNRNYTKDGSIVHCVWFNSALLDENGKLLSILSLMHNVTERKQAEEALRKSEENLSTTLRSIGDGVISTDINGWIVNMNPIAEALCGWKLTDALGKPLTEVFKIINNITRETVTDPVIKVLENGQIVGLANHTVLISRDGTEYQIADSAAPIKNKEGEITGVVLVFSDVTEKYVAQKQIKESEERFQLAMNASNDGLFDWNLETNNTYYSPGWKRILGYEDDEIPNDFSIWEHTTKPEDVKKSWELQQKLIKKQIDRFVMEFKMKHKKGHWVDILSRAEAIFNDNGKAIRIVGTHTDITELKKAEEKLRESEENLSTTLRSIGDGVISTDINGLIVNMNRIAEELCGCELNDALGKPLPEVFKIINDITRETVANPVKKVLENGQIVGLANHTVLISKNGNEYQIADSAAPIKNKEGEITGVVLVFSDVTEKYAAEMALKESETRFRKMFEDGATGMVLVGNDYRFRRANQTFCKMTGYSEKELLQLTFAEITHPADSTKDIQQVKKLTEGKIDVYRTEKRYLKKDGQIFWAELTVSSIADSKGAFLYNVAIIIDITERKQAEIALLTAKEKAEENEAKFRSLFNRVADAIFIYDPNTFEIIEANEATSRIYGYNSGELIGMSILKFSGEVEKSKYVVKNIEQKGEMLVNFRHHKKKDGADLFVQLQGYKIVVDNKPLTFAVCHDITDAVKLEKDLIAAKEEAQESDRLKSAFLANMSHEIRTPMNGILGFAELLKTPGLTGEEQRNYIRIIEKSGARMLNIINDIIDISKIEAGLMNLNIKETNINEQIEYIYTFFKPEIEGKGMRLSFNNSLPSKEATLKTDREKVYAILTNLVKNAIKYSKNGSIEFGYVKKGSFLEFFVKDTGIGIPKDRQEAIFERFIQADIADKNAYQGAGLGLSISKAYIEMLGGKIWVESDEGKGSVFYFTIPFNVEPELKISVENLVMTKSKTPIKPLKILIAEDDETSAMLLSTYVRKFTKDILKVETGNAAVESYRKHPDIDLILMDIQMPGLDGYEATRQIRAFSKDVVIIAQTAYAISGDREKAIEAGCNDYISKPIDKTKLQTMLVKFFGE